MTKMTRTLPVAKALETAEALDLPDLLDAVQQAMDEGWSVVDFTLTEDGGNVEIAPHTGVMVAFMLPGYLADRLELDGGERDLHITLAYLGDVSELTYVQQRTLVGVVAEVASSAREMYGLIQGTDTFTPTDSSDGRVPWYAAVNVPGLAELREELVTKLQEADLPVNLTHPDYTPHITLAYFDSEDDVPSGVTIDPVPFDLDTLTVCIATNRTDLPLSRAGYDEWDEDRQMYVEDAYWADRRAFYAAETGDEYPYSDSVYRPLTKALEMAERQFTLGPWYLPNTEDAHGDWTDPDTLQQAAWDYVDAGYRGIHLQHMPDVVAGRWVEIMTLPHETTWPVTDPNGNVAAHIYPAGTVMLGVIWEDWAWELVKTGAITGYSIGGNAMMTDEDAPAADDGPAMPPIGSVPSPASPF